MLVVLVLAVQLLAFGLGVHAYDDDTEICFAEANYITCEDVPGRPQKCDCGGLTECHIHLEITREPHSEPGEQDEYEYLLNGERGQGPTIIADYNTLVVVDVHNNMVENTSIHWHGMHQVGFPWMDGVGLITQQPIKPNGRFRYIFRALPQGTHWYHSHTDFQRDAGLLGALIVREKENQQLPGDIVDTPETHTLVLQELKEVSSEKSTETRYCLPDGSPVPFQFHKISLRLNGRRLAAKDSEGTHESPLLFFVEPGQNYRFRIVGAMSSDLYSISIDGHKMHVVATDGYLVRRFTTDYLILHVSERYDFVVEAKEDIPIPLIPGIRLFPIRVHTLAEECGSNGKFAGSGYAYLVYRRRYARRFFRNRNRIGRFLPWAWRKRETKYTVLNCPMKNLPDGYFGHGTTTECHNVRSLQLQYPTAPSQIPSDNPTTEAFFDFSTSGGPNINGIRFQNPTTPLVDNTKEETKNCRYPVECDTTGQTHCTHAIYFGEDQGTARFVFSAHGGSVEGFSSYVTHPIHMHGHSYFVAKVGYPEYDESGKIIEVNNDLQVPDCGHGDWTDGEEPEGISVNRTTVRKDVVIVPAGGYVVVHFLADSPGYWFMHCHIDGHLNNGMAIALGENIDCARLPPDQLLDPNALDFCLSIDDYKEMEATPAVCRNQRVKTKRKLSKYGYPAK